VIDLEDKEQHIIDHLGELRKRILISLLFFLVFFIAGFIYVEEIYQWFTRDLEFSLVVLGPSDILYIYFIIAAVVAVAGSIPIIALQIWLFIRPALMPHEIKTTLNYIPALFLLFIGGLSFGYFVIFPIVLHFLVGLSEGMFTTNFTAVKYFQFILHMTLPFAVLFELPVIAMFLTSIGLINPYVLQKFRKYAYFVLVVIAIVITPPDFVSDFLVIVPLLFLYEVSVSLSKIIFKRKQKREALYEQKVNEEETQ
jgi:sec-independent protein translocase protein TatC